MKMSGRMYFILSFMLMCFIAFNVDCSTPWDDFLRRPDQEALSALNESVGASALHCTWGNPINKEIAPTPKQNNQLFLLIREGNEAAFGAVLIVVKCLDGGELEDFNRSAGVFFERQPRLFLQMVKEKSFEDSELKSLLTMLPLETTDDIDRKLVIVKNRISLLKGIKDESLFAIREKGLKYLNKEIIRLDRIKNEMIK